MRRVSVPQFAVHVASHDLPGGEPAVVFLHGLGSAASADFPAVVRDPLLAPRRALLVDMPGFGFSDQPPGFPHTLEAHADVVARVLDDLGVSRCVVVGHSFGGSVATVLAASRPDLVAALIVAEPNLEPEDATFSRMVVEAAPTEDDYVAPGHAAIVAEVERWAEDDPAMDSFPGTLRIADPRAVYRCSMALVTCSLGAAFAALPMPRTYVFGERTLPHRHRAMMDDAGVAVAIVPDAGHGMVGENPAAFAQIVARAAPAATGA